MVKNQNAGKGMRPKIGYNYKNWSEGWDFIHWGHKEKEKTNERINERTETISGSNGQ